MSEFCRWLFVMYVYLHIIITFINSWSSKSRHSSFAHTVGGLIWVFLVTLVMYVGRLLPGM